VNKHYDIISGQETFPDHFFCVDKDRVKEYPVTEFEFLGYTFSQSFQRQDKSYAIHSHTGTKIEMIAEMLSPMVRGWLNYFTKFNPSAVSTPLTV
jgi:RNA-directed DNA polymerase